MMGVRLLPFEVSSRMFSRSLKRDWSTFLEVSPAREERGVPESENWALLKWEHKGLIRRRGAADLRPLKQFMMSECGVVTGFMLLLEG